MLNNLFLFHTTNSAIQTMQFKKKETSKASPLILPAFFSEADPGSRSKERAPIQKIIVSMSWRDWSDWIYRAGYQGGRYDQQNTLQICTAFPLGLLLEPKSWWVGQNSRRMSREWRGSSKLGNSQCSFRAGRRLSREVSVNPETVSRNSRRVRSS